MKTKLIAIALMAALVSTASAENFESWMARVYKIAPRYHLKLHPKDELLTATEREWFHLYYWQNGVSPERAVRATRYSVAFLNRDIYVKQPLWHVSYVCYVSGKADSIGCREVTALSRQAARKQFHREVFGETCQITNVERAKDPFTHRPLFQ
jgi:hypothetical protein